jgi:hypothetical protein
MLFDGRSHMAITSADGKTGLLASAPTKEALEKAINEYFYAGNDLIITDAKEVYSQRKNKALDSYRVTVRRGRWRFEIIYN